MGLLQLSLTVQSALLHPLKQDTGVPGVEICRDFFSKLEDCVALKIYFIFINTCSVEESHFSRDTVTRSIFFSKSSHKKFKSWTKVPNLKKLKCLVKRTKEKVSVRCITITSTQEASGATWQSLVSFPVSGSSAHC